jgi:flagellar protein FlaG
MALDALSSAVYHDTAKIVPKTDQKVSDFNAHDPGTMNINITETPAAAKTSAGNQTDAQADKGQKDLASKAKQIKDAISQANNKMKLRKTRCEFSYHEDTKRVSIKVFDRDTEEIIREIPPEESLDMIEKMWELAGLIVDEKR